MNTDTQSIEQLANREYKFGFVTDIEQETCPPASTRKSCAASRPRRGSRSG
jgi:hypothetical protein